MKNHSNIIFYLNLIFLYDFPFIFTFSSGGASFARDDDIENCPHAFACVHWSVCRGVLSHFFPLFAYLSDFLFFLFLSCLNIVFASVFSTCRWRMAAVSNSIKIVCKKSKWIQLAERHIFQWNLISLSWISMKSHHQWNGNTHRKIWTVWSITFPTLNPVFVSSRQKKIELNDRHLNVTCIVTFWWTHRRTHTRIYNFTGNQFFQCDLHSFIIITNINFVLFDKLFSCG